MATIDGRPAQYGITLKQLRELMEARGREGIAKVQDYGGVQDICKKLYTSPSEGDYKEYNRIEYFSIFGNWILVGTDPYCKNLIPCAQKYHTEKQISVLLKIVCCRCYESMHTFIKFLVKEQNKAKGFIQIYTPIWLFLCVWFSIPLAVLNLVT